MPVTMQRDAIAEIVRLLIEGRDYRDIPVDMIDKIFIDHVLTFFEQVVLAKMRLETISIDWYRERFLDSNLDKADVAMNAGLNIKTITNKHRSSKKEIVMHEAILHHDKFVELIESLSDEDVNVSLSLTWRDITVHLNLNESLIVINALAVRRAALRRGVWSTTGKQVEVPLMEVLCRIFQVAESCFAKSLHDDESIREIDFYLKPPNHAAVKCEVKLMGQGNPEGADAIHARESEVFVASTLSDLNKIQLDEAGVLWTELQRPNGFLRFQRTLARLRVPHKPIGYGEDATERIEAAVRDTFGIA